MMRRFGVGRSGSLFPWDWDTYESPLPPVVVLAVHLAASVGLLLVGCAAGRQSAPPSACLPRDSLRRMVTDAGPDAVHSGLDPQEIAARLDALERASDERRAELRAVLDDLPAALSRRALVSAAITDARSAPRQGRDRHAGPAQGRTDAGGSVAARPRSPGRVMRESDLDPCGCSSPATATGSCATSPAGSSMPPSQAGRAAALVDDRLPPPDGAINLVVAPHEFFLLRDDDDATIRAAARCSIPVCTEQPGTPWFLLSLGFCVGSPLVVDINAVGVEAIEREGFRAHRLQLGGVAPMDHWTRRRARSDDDGETWTSCSSAARPSAGPPRWLGWLRCCGIDPVSCGCSRSAVR